VVREGVGQGEEMTQALYAHMNNNKKNQPFVFITHLLCVRYMKILKISLILNSFFSLVMDLK
jgi:hypothetical protein